MAIRSSMSRRNFMQQSALWAAAFAGAGRLTASSAQAARDKELNILCWEGYNSAQVLDPFRSSTGGGHEVCEGLERTGSLRVRWWRFCFVFLARGPCLCVLR